MTEQSISFEHTPARTAFRELAGDTNRYLNTVLVDLEPLRKQLGLGADPYAPADNITAGAAYLQQMYRRYGYPEMFAAYNAGPGRFDDFLLRQRPLSSETLAYIAKIAPGAETAFSSIGLPLGSLTLRVASPRSLAHSEAFFVSLDTHNALFVPLSQPNP